MNDIKDLETSDSSPVLSIDSDTNYWFIRANGGKFYTDFLENQFVALSDNNIKKIDLNSTNAEDNRNIKSVEGIRDIYEIKYPEYNPQQLTLYSKRLYNFAYGMKIGDIVLVPSKSSFRFLVGVVASGLYDEDIKITDTKRYNYSRCNYIKRRKIIWIKEISRTELPQKMYWVLSAHQSFFDVTEYSDRINDIICPIYKYKERFHTNVFVDMEDKLSLKDWNQITALLVTKLDSNAIKMEADIHSPGWLNFLCVADPNQLKSLLTALIYIIDTKKDPILTVSSSFTGVWILMKIIGGKKLKEEGLIEWIQNRYSQHIDNKSKKLDLEKKEHDINVSLQMKDIGTEIKNKDTTIGFKKNVNGIDEILTKDQKNNSNEDSSD